jgi:hypothetical protein
MIRRLTREGAILASRIKRKLKPYNITKADFGAASEELNKPLLISCLPGFDQAFPNASTLMRVGFANGWAAACGPARLIPITRLMKEIDKWDKPAIFMTLYDYKYITVKDSIRLRDYDVFVWIGIHPNKLSEYQKHALIPQQDRSAIAETRNRILLSEPKFVWNSTCARAMHWYQGWVDDGLKWITIHPAVDQLQYYPDPNPSQFGAIKMAYVGGYWGEKAQAFDTYLRPWDDILVPFGYQAWPYKNYGGMLDLTRERQLYSTCGLIPLVTSPAGWDIGELTERYFKAPACKAFCIADQNPALRDVFAENEMLQAKTPEHFQDLVRDYLAGKIDTAWWAERAHSAVMRGHLYEHRALQILNALNSPPL